MSWGAGNYSVHYLFIKVLAVLKLWSVVLLIKPSIINVVDDDWTAADSSDENESRLRKG